MKHLLQLIRSLIKKDYEPYPIERDTRIEKLLTKHGISFKRFKEFNVLTSTEGTGRSRQADKLHKILLPFPELAKTGFRKSSIQARPYDLSFIPEYGKYRDFPAKEQWTPIKQESRYA